MYRTFTLIACCLILISIIGCGREGGVAVSFRDKSPVLAKIGMEAITMKDFNEKLDNLPENIKMIAESNKAAYLDNLVVETLLYREALRKKMHEDPEVKLLLEEARKRILIARLAKDEIDSKISVADNEVINYYKDHRAEMESPELFRASHILVDTLQDAAEVVDRINAGAIFEELARKYSKDVTSSRGGDVGYFSSGQMVPEFEDACLRLKIDEVSGPVKTEFGYHIIKLTDKRSPEPIELDRMRPKIETLLIAQKRGRLLEKLVTRLKSETKVVMNSELLVNESPKGPLTENLLGGTEEMETLPK